MLLQGRTFLLPLAVLASYSHTVAGANAQCRTYTMTVLVPASSCSAKGATNTGMPTASPVSVQRSAVEVSSAPASSQSETPAVFLQPNVGGEDNGNGNEEEPAGTTAPTAPSPTPKEPSDSSEPFAVQQTTDAATPTFSPEVTPAVATPLPLVGMGGEGEEGQPGVGEGGGAGGQDSTSGTGPGKPDEPGPPPPPPPPPSGNSGGPPSPTETGSPAEPGNSNEPLNPSATQSPPSRPGSNNSADSSAPAAAGTDSMSSPRTTGPGSQSTSEANKSFVTLIEPWTGIVRTISKPTTIAKIPGSGTAPGTIVIATPAVFVTTTSKGAAGTTTVPPSGTAPGTVVVGA